NSDRSRIYELKSLNQLIELSTSLDLRRQWISILGEPTGQTVWISTSKEIGGVGNDGITTLYRAGADSFIVGPSGPQGMRASPSGFYFMEKHSILRTSSVMRICRTELDPSCN